MRIISIVVFSVILLAASPVMAEEGNTNINTKINLKDNLMRLVEYFVPGRVTETAQAEEAPQAEPEAEEAVEVQSPEDAKAEAVLARWKTKQAHLKAPEGKFIINASAYTAAADECGKSDGITASGTKVKEGRTLACPPNYAFGTKIRIEGVGVRVCEDRGGAIKGNHFDIYMETKHDAFQFGRRNLEAEVVK